MPPSLVAAFMPAVGTDAQRTNMCTNETASGGSHSPHVLRDTAGGSMAKRLQRGFEKNPEREWGETQAEEKREKNALGTVVRAPAREKKAFFGSLSHTCPALGG